MAKLTERYSCGHVRKEKNKHLCPQCRAARQASGRRKQQTGHVEQRVISAARRRAAVGRLEELLDGTEGLTLVEIGSRIGVSKQRVWQMQKFLAKHKKNEPPAAIHHATAGGSGVQTDAIITIRAGKATEVCPC